MNKLRERPFAHTKVTQLISRQIDKLASRKSQREIASEVGYDKPNMLSMIKYGDSRLPLDKVPIFAKALELDVGFLFRNALEQYWPDLNKVLQDAGVEVLSKSEKQLFKRLHDEFVEEPMPALSEKQIKEIIKVIGK